MSFASDTFFFFFFFFFFCFVFLLLSFFIFLTLSTVLAWGEFRLKESVIASLILPLKMKLIVYVDKVHLGQKKAELWSTECFGKQICKLWFSYDMEQLNDSLQHLISDNMCLVLSWNTGLAPMCKAAWLSQNNKAALGCATWKSLRR